MQFYLPKKPIEKHKNMIQQTIELLELYCQQNNGQQLTKLNNQKNNPGKIGLKTTLSSKEISQTPKVVEAASNQKLMLEAVLYKESVEITSSSPSLSCPQHSQLVENYKMSNLSSMTKKQRSKHNSTLKLKSQSTKGCPLQSKNLNMLETPNKEPPILGFGLDAPT